MIKPQVLSVSISPTHSMAKMVQSEIKLLTGIGIEGDVHSGDKVKHRSRLFKKPLAPNLRQVHLIHWELLEELNLKGFKISPGQMGENMTTKNIDILNLPTNTLLTIGKEALIQITGLRNPCTQLDGIQKGLMKAVLDKDDEGNLIKKAGVMAIVLKGGLVKPGDEIVVKLPALPYTKLMPV
jgi:hypothetical protein